MSCVLRVSGKNLAVDDLLKIISWSPICVWHVGETRPAPGLRNSQQLTSGFNIEVSKRDMSDLSGQLDDALNFVKANNAALERVSSFPGVDDLDMDFALSWPRENPMFTDHIPWEFIAAINEFRVSISLSHYETDQESTP
jgi:hypothetical protein